MPTENDKDLMHEGNFHFKVKEFDTTRDYDEHAPESADAQQTRAQVNDYLSLLKVDPIQNLSYSTSGIMVSTFKFDLVPVWVTEIRAFDRTSRVFINGRTSTVHSEISEHCLAGLLENTLGRQQG